MQAHAHADGTAFWPGMGRERLLGLGLDFVAVVGGDGLSQEAMMVREHLGVAVTEASQELRRALDVGEQERDVAGGEIGHDRILETASQGFFEGYYTLEEFLDEPEVRYAYRRGTALLHLTVLRVPEQSPPALLPVWIARKG
ncbi:MAG: hypothetical protein ACR2HB_02565 [Dehalococcoidia bacterium]